MKKLFRAVQIHYVKPNNVRAVYAIASLGLRTLWGSCRCVSAQYVCVCVCVCVNVCRCFVSSAVKTGKRGEEGGWEGGKMTGAPVDTNWWGLEQTSHPSSVHMIFQGDLEKSNHLVMMRSLWNVRVKGGINNICGNLAGKSDPNCYLLDFKKCFSCLIFSQEDRKGKFPHLVKCFNSLTLLSIPLQTWMSLYIKWKSVQVTAKWCQPATKRIKRCESSLQTEGY